MDKKFAHGVFALMILCAGAAHAGPLPRNGLAGDGRGWFYNRTGATPGEVKRDLDACRDFGRALTFAQTGYTAGAMVQFGLIGGLVGGLIEGGVEVALEVGPRRAYADDCMIGRGYRRFNTNDESITAFTRRYEAMDLAMQSALSGSETPPEGVLARQWFNSYWIPSDDDPTPAPHQRIAAAFVPGSTANSVTIRPLESGAAITLGANDAVVIASLRYEGGIGARATVTFTRDGSETGLPQTTPMGRRQRPQWPVVEVRSDRARARGSHTTSPMIFVIPAGTYGLGSAELSGDTTQFCLGTIAFTIEAGQTLHLGSFTMRPGSGALHGSAPPAYFGLRIDQPDLEAGRAILGSVPELAARLQPATYRNGFVRACEPQIDGTIAPIYGFDHPAGIWPEVEAQDSQPAVIEEADNAPVETPSPDVNYAVPVEP